MRTALVIEDNPEIRENTTEILELAGYRVIAAENGFVGVKAAEEQQPDIILCDIMMPGMNGYEVIKKLRSNPATSSIPFLYVTASVEKSEVKAAMDMGANGYVRKPFDISELISAINECLQAK